MRTAALVSLVAAIGFLTVVVADAARADAPPPDAHIVIAVDTTAVTRSDADSRVAKTVALNAAAAWRGGTIALLAYGNGVGEPVSFSMGSEELDAAVEQFAEGLGGVAAIRGSNQFRALAAIFEYLSVTAAPSGSRAILVTDDGLEKDNEGERQRLLGFAGLLAGEGWALDVVALPSASPPGREYLSELATVAGGTSYDGGTVEGLASFLNDAYSIEPVPAIQTALAAVASALSAVEVAPMTTELIVSAVRSGADAGFELFDPRGAPVGVLRADASIFETPSSMVIRVTEPEAGTWTVQASGDGMDLMVSVYIENPLQVALVDGPPAPVGESTLFEAAATVDGRPTALPGAYVEAAIRNPAGESAVYRLHDDGTGGDESAGDGIFSVVIPGPNAQQLNDVSLVLRWQSFGAEIRGQDVLPTENFPVMTVATLEPGSITHGDEVRVGVIEIHVVEYPHPVDPAALSVGLVKGDESEVDALLVPRNPADDGSAWQFDIWSAPTTSGRYTVEARLTGSYLGREYTVGTGGAHLNLEVVPQPPVRTITIRPGLTTTVPVWGLTLIAVGILGLVAGLVATFARLRIIEPYGYLYDDRGRLAVDFRRVRPSSLARMFSRNRLRLKELPGLSLAGGELIFRPNAVELLTLAGEHTSVRIDGRPAGRLERITEGVRLGIGGRLLTFALIPFQSPAAAGGD